MSTEGYGKGCSQQGVVIPAFDAGPVGEGAPQRIGEYLRCTTIGKLPRSSAASAEQDLGACIRQVCDRQGRVTGVMLPVATTRHKDPS